MIEVSTLVDALHVFDRSSAYLNGIWTVIRAFLSRSNHRQADERSNSINLIAVATELCHSTCRKYGFGPTNLEHNQDGRTGLITPYT